MKNNLAKESSAEGCDNLLIFVEEDLGRHICLVVFIITLYISNAIVITLLNNAGPWNITVKC